MGDERSREPERPFLYVRVRPQDAAAAAEYESFREGMGLTERELDRHDLVRAPLPDGVFERYRGVVVGGSPFNLTDPDHMKTDEQRTVEAGLTAIAERAAAGELHALFTCFGIGIVTRMLGGTVSTRFPEGTGPTAVSLTDAGAADPLFGGLPRTFSALTAHKEGTESLPTGAVLLATNDACPVQAYSVGLTLHATQFHPEPTPRAFTERMAIYRNDGYFDADAFDEVAARVLTADVTEPLRLLRAFVRAAR